MRAQWIQTGDGLTALLAQLQAANLHHEFLALDTEFLRRTTFFAQPCLLQLGWQDSTGCIHIFLIDLFIRKQLLKAFIQKLYSICENRCLTLAMHAPTEDLNILRQIGVTDMPLRFLDTQVAAAYLGFRAHVSLADLTEALLKIPVKASCAQSDWTERPLNWQQLSYAADDVIHTCQLAQFAHRIQERRGYRNS